MTKPLKLTLADRIRGLSEVMQTTNRIQRLRTALSDAIHQCEKCKGTGRIAMPGAHMACPRCSYWRTTLRETQ